MAGGFDPIDPQRCEHYAGFASHLDRRSFDFIYWFLFALVIFMLFLSSWKYSGLQVRLLGLEAGSRGYRNRMKKCMLICSIYASVSIIAVIMEVYALMALQFCDGEDLMSLYWSTWTMLQVGSVIAILGILLAVFNSLRGNKNPPWALALGTPVLVVAGIGHAVHGAMRKRVQRVRSRSRSRRRGVSACSSRRHLEAADLTISREQTIRADDSEKEDTEIAARFLGFTPEGSPIVKFVDDPGRIEPDHGVIIGRSDGNVIVAFRKPMTVISAELQSPPPSPSYPSPSPMTPPPAITTTTTTSAVGMSRVRIATPERRISVDSPV
ncbi:hypothetical protein MMYC01_202854 [Madurella mycetomatis]|uniref:Uncharacterized protein n=1 Tax=Madurella mycetomatis TaxID=100816 RepID=A0A175W8Q4_9PEZI|nr:hypothetical protein MMYC01_202854 [Madurella mycetomatis]